MHSANHTTTQTPTPHDATPHHAPRALSASLFSYVVFFILLSIAIQLLSGGYKSDHGQGSDEAGHFVTALMIHDYLFGHFGENPVAFAKEYYLHFPRVALGHWPPMFEVTQAILFTLGRNSTVAVAYQAIIAGLLAGLPAAVVGRRFGALLGFAAGITALLTPYALFLINLIMADNMLAVLVFASGLAWEQLYYRRTWRCSLIFAFTASAAILTKGSGFGLSLLPLFFLLIKRDLKSITCSKFIVSGALIAFATIPWYVATYKYAADGFNYSWGWTFSRKAIPIYCAGLVTSVGLPVVAGYFLGVLRVFLGKADADVGHASTSLAMLFFACIAPADITTRYLIPAVPGMVVVAVSGLHVMFDAPPISAKIGAWPKRFGPAVCMMISVATIFQEPHIEPFYATDVAKIVSNMGANPLVLVSGGIAAEGAVITAFAKNERLPYHYIVRGTKVLSSSNFMGSDYQTRFNNASDVDKWIKANKIGYIIFYTDSDGNRFAHNGMLRATLESDTDYYKMQAVVGGLRGDALIYALPNADYIPGPDATIFSEISLRK